MAASLLNRERDKNRVVLHSDGNSFYVTIETLYRPHLRGKAVAVGGDPAARHGIILTATPQQKRRASRLAWPSGRQSSYVRS